MKKGIIIIEDEQGEENYCWRSRISRIRKHQLLGMNKGRRAIAQDEKKNNMKKKKTIVLLGMNKGRWTIAKDQEKEINYNNSCWGWIRKKILLWIKKKRIQQLLGMNKDKSYYWRWKRRE